MIITYLLLFGLIYGILILLCNTKKEKFDGIGKNFGVYYKPHDICIPQLNCYPGSYVNSSW